METVAINDTEGDGKGPSSFQQPSLTNFQERINELRAEEMEIKAIDSSIVEGWLKIDAKPIKNALSATAAKWSATHTTYLKEYVESQLTELQDFISRVTTGLANEVDENDQAGLIAAMTYVRDVRISSDRIDGLFEPRAVLAGVGGGLRIKGRQGLVVGAS